MVDWFMVDLTLYSSTVCMAFLYVTMFLVTWWCGFLVGDYIKVPVVGKIAGVIWLVTVADIVIMIIVGLNTIWQKVG